MSEVYLFNHAVESRLFAQDAAELVRVDCLYPKVTRPPNQRGQVCRTASSYGLTMQTFMSALLASWRHYPRRSTHIANALWTTIIVAYFY